MSIFPLHWIPLEWIWWNFGLIVNYWCKWDVEIDVVWCHFKSVPYILQRPLFSMKLFSSFLKSFFFFLFEWNIFFLASVFVDFVSQWNDVESVVRSLSFSSFPIFFFGFFLFGGDIGSTGSFRWFAILIRHERPRNENERAGQDEQRERERMREWENERKADKKRERKREREMWMEGGRGRRWGLFRNGEGRHQLGTKTETEKESSKTSTNQTTTTTSTTTTKTTTTTTTTKSHR